MEKYADAKVNCATCVKWDKHQHRCRDESAVLQRYEDSSRFDMYDKLMRDAKDIRVD